MAAATTSTIGRRNSGAFTLMELVLVLVVVSVVLAMAAPSLRGFFASRQTADAATTMLSLTKWARSQALAQGCPCRLNIDSESGTCWLTVQQAGAFVDLNCEMGRRFRLPEGASVSVRTDPAGPDVPYVQFYPNGRSDAITIEIHGRQGEVFLVSTPSAVEPYRIVSPSEAQRP